MLYAKISNQNSGHFHHTLAITDTLANDCPEGVHHDYNES